MSANDSPDEADSPEDEYVIGRELARAAEAEERRMAERPSGKSPMPTAEYDSARNELGLINPSPSALDAELRELCRRYAESDAQQRSEIRNSISMGEFYTLLTFGRRSAVFAMRRRETEVAADGLTAVAMIDQERVDFRDILICLALLYHSATDAGADADEMLRRAATLADPGTAELLIGFADQTPQHRDLRTSWGYDEVETDDGVGLIGWGFREYDPAADLKALVIEVAHLVAADSYHPDSVEVASELPETWLSGGDMTGARRALASVRGGASISASLRPGEHAANDAQILMVFLVETVTEADAQVLLRSAQGKRTFLQKLLWLFHDEKPLRFRRLGLAAGRLFCLVIAESFMADVEAFETRRSLSRFSEGLQAILDRHAKTAR